jgi:hypothetical protein
MMLTNSKPTEQSGTLPNISRLKKIKEKRI